MNSPDQTREAGTRRDFLKKAGLTTTVLAAAEPGWLAAKPGPAPAAKLPWYRRTLRWGQTRGFSVTAVDKMVVRNLASAAVCGIGRMKYRRAGVKDRVCLRGRGAQRSGRMTNTAWKVLGVALAASVWASAASPPEAEITNGPIRLRLYLPDAKTGFYRGTRFDWAGVLGGLQYAGHSYYPQWFQRSDPSVHDFIDDGADIVAGPCTAITGPAEEFGANGKGLGFDEARAGGTFVKIGVGVLRKPDDHNYDPFRLYPIADGGRWTVTRRPDSIEFRHELADPATGYAYEYRKTVSVAGDKPRMVLDHGLRNTGKRVIQTSVYNHNFLYLDRQAPSPDFLLTVPFKISTSQPPDGRLAEVRGNQIAFPKTLTGEDRVYLDIQGFGADPKDYDLRIENRNVGAGVRITADRPLSRLALWAIRAPLAIEPFIDMNIEPGAEFTWRIKYEFYTIPAGGK